MEDLPNGFTGFAHRKEGFVSAGEASRISRGVATARPSASPIPHHVREAAAAVSTEPPAKAVPFADAELARVSTAEARGAWIQIDLAAVRYNVAQTRRLLQPRCRLMAVVEADAYGHGAVEVAKAALGAGADHLGVTTLTEALELRDAGITAPIVLLAQPTAASAPLLLAHKIVPSAYEPDFAIAYAEVADRHGIKAPYHLLLNTGMNHLGVAYYNAVEFLHQVSFHRALELEGTLTHFATADCPETLDFHIQAKRFVEAIEAMHAAGFDPGIVHCANTAALYRFPDVHFDMARMGISLCGLHPCAQTRSLVDLRPAMSVHARIVDMRTVGVSEGVSHGLRYRSPGAVKVCTIPLGYADGLRFGLSDNVDFIVQGRYFRQVGEICLSHCMFEVDLRRTPAREQVNMQVGDEVIVVGSQGIAEATLDEMAERLRTTNYEVAMGFGQRLPRIYV